MEPRCPYTVSVRSQCSTTREPKWSKWNNNGIGWLAVRDGISATPVPALVTVAPNPTRGVTTVTLTAEVVATGCSLTRRNVRLVTGNASCTIAMQRIVAKKLGAD